MDNTSILKFASNKTCMGRASVNNQPHILHRFLTILRDYNLIRPRDKKMIIEITHVNSDSSIPYSLPLSVSGFIYNPLQKKKIWTINYHYKSPTTLYSIVDKNHFYPNIPGCQLEYSYVTIVPESSFEESKRKLHLTLEALWGHTLNPTQAYKLGDLLKIGKTIIVMGPHCGVKRVAFRVPCFELDITPHIGTYCTCAEKELLYMMPLCDSKIIPLYDSNTINKKSRFLHYHLVYSFKGSQMKSGSIYRLYLPTRHLGLNLGVKMIGVRISLKFVLIISRELSYLKGLTEQERIHALDTGLVYI
jgi:hypothetical protein